jgi:hypothetical protein
MPTIEVFEYTTRTTSRLLVSTFHDDTTDPGATGGEDTLVSITTECNAHGVEIGCNDNVPGADLLRDFPMNMLPPVTATSIVTTADTRNFADWTTVAGTTVYIFVAGTSPSMRFPHDYHLSVTEIPLPPSVGSPCEPASTPSTCAMNTTCVAVGTDYSSFACASDGARFARCRMGGAPCDTGLTCATASYYAFPTCVTAVAVGASCDPHINTESCVDGSTCSLALETDALGTCVADGARGGLCRASAPVCDAGLSCLSRPDFSALHCLTPIANGATCNPSDDRSGCLMGSACVASTPTTGTCIVTGSRGGYCRVSSPQCDPGLSCSTTSLTCM